MTVRVTLTAEEWRSLAFDTNKSDPAWRELWRLGRMTEVAPYRRLLTAHLSEDHAEVIRRRFPLALTDRTGG